MLTAFISKLWKRRAGIVLVGRQPLHIIVFVHLKSNSLLPTVVENQDGDNIHNL